MRREQRGVFYAAQDLTRGYARLGARALTCARQRAAARRTTPAASAAGADVFLADCCSQIRGAFTISLTHSRARGADDVGRRWRDASYGVARDSNPVSTTAAACSLSPTIPAGALVFFIPWRVAAANLARRISTWCSGRWPHDGEVAAGGDFVLAILRFGPLLEFGRSERSSQGGIADNRQNSAALRWGPAACSPASTQPGVRRRRRHLRQYGLSRAIGDSRE